MNIQLDLFAPPPKDPAHEHCRMWKLCWDWEGPKIGGRCQVNNCIVRNETHGDLSYHYMAPCEIIAQDGEDWLCRIDYQPECWCADAYNGQILRLGVMDIWPPVHYLIAKRAEEGK
jgi:hypothetical protein